MMGVGREGRKEGGKEGEALRLFIRVSILQTRIVEREREKKRGRTRRKEGGSRL